ncbi:MAG: alpha/beta hydrolase, partial [Hyphomicrobiales bacterium]|nr:alpha/beta hydrolase [Hyphomicrobiales bacterium]
MDLVGIRKNPIPRGSICDMLECGPKVKLRYARWKPTTQRAKGTVCLFHGRNEFIEKYFEVIGELRKRGFAVATMDWRGQGRSTRMGGLSSAGHVDDFS